MGIAARRIVKHELCHLEMKLFGWQRVSNGAQLVTLAMSCELSMVDEREGENIFSSVTVYLLDKLSTLVK